MIKTQVQNIAPVKRLFINMIGKIEVIQINDLIYLQACSNYTELILKNGTVFKASKSLKTYFDQIESHPDFIKIHRSYVINKTYLKQIIRENNKTSVVMIDNKELEISPIKKDEILNKLIY
jgi:two-component system LytT family response regulator